jgi:hypothetical protein
MCCGGRSVVIISHAFVPTAGEAGVGFDPFMQFTREQATVRALRDRARDVDISTTSRAGYHRRYEAALAGAGA